MSYKFHNCSTRYSIPPNWCAFAFVFPAIALSMDVSAECGITAPGHVLVAQKAYQTVVTDDPFCCNANWDSVCEGAFAALLSAEDAGGGGVPDNDECANAAYIPVLWNGTCPGGGVEGDMTAATSSALAVPSCMTAGITLTDVFYAFNSGSNSSLQVYLTLGTMSAWGIQVLDACDGNEVFCVQGLATGIFTVDPGMDYILRLLTLPAFAGTYAICLQAPGAPANDDCANATMLIAGEECVGTLAWSYTSTQSIPPVTCSGWTSGTANDVWFQFVATSETQIIEVDGTIDMVLGIYSDCSTLIACMDSLYIAPHYETLTQSGLAVGRTYYVRVYGFAGTTGNFYICVHRDIENGIENHSNNGNGLSLWPNPTNGQEILFELEGLAGNVHTIAVDIYDLTGKRIVTREMAAQYGPTQVELNGEIAAGTYVVTITAGDLRYVERLVIGD